MVDFVSDREVFSTQARHLDSVLAEREKTRDKLQKEEQVCQFLGVGGEGARGPPFASVNIPRNFSVNQ